MVLRGAGQTQTDLVLINPRATAAGADTVSEAGQITVKDDGFGLAVCQSQSGDCFLS
jgi:hypothetical protein